MTKVISHTAALEAMRSEGVAASIELRRPAPPPPSKAPGGGEVELWLASSPIARGLLGPIVLLGTGENASKRCRGFEVRSLTCELPPGSILALDDETSIVSPELLLLQMARSATDAELAMLVCELAGLYAIAPGSREGMVQRSVPLTTLSRVLEFLNGVGKARGSAKLRRAVEHAFDRCASPQESKLAARVSWSWSEGGYNVPVISMNEEIEVKRIERRLAKDHVRKPDLLLRLPSEDQTGICLDYHGWNHMEVGRHQADDLRTNELLAYNIKPYTIWADQYRSTSYMDGLIGGVIRRELGLPRHRPYAQRACVELAKREALLSELNVIDGLSWGVSKDHDEVRAALARVDEARERPLDQYL